MKFEEKIKTIKML